MSQEIDKTHNHDVEREPSHGVVDATGGLAPGELYELKVCAVFSGQQNPGPACATIEHRAA